MFKSKRIVCFVIFFSISLLFGIYFFLKHIGYRSSSPAEYTQTVPKNLQEVIGYDDFISISSEGPIIPGLSEGLIPQGLCYVNKHAVFLSTGYHKGGAPSTIFVVDKESGTLLKSVILYDNEGTPFHGHVGGIASDGDWIWISSENRVYTIPYEILENASNMDSISLSEGFECFVNADYIYWDGTYLWIGEYNYAPFYKTDSTHYSVDSDGKEYNALVLGYSVFFTDGTIEKAKIALYVPDKVQGIIMQKDGSIILSCSFWCFEDSKLMCYSLIENSNNSSTIINEKPIPLFYLKDQYLQWELVMPPMSEGIALADSNYYILFESTSKLYSWYSNNQLSNIMIVPSQQIFTKEDN